MGELKGDAGFLMFLTGLLLVTAAASAAQQQAADWKKLAVLHSPLSEGDKRGSPPVNKQTLWNRTGTQEHEAPLT